MLDKLDIKLVTDNKKFLTTIKPIPSHKISKYSKIIIVQGDEIISANKDAAQKFHKLNKNTVSSLNIQCDIKFVNECDGLVDPVDIAIQKFKNHTSITSINENIASPEIFNIHKINLDSILKEDKKLIFQGHSL